MYMKRKIIRNDNYCIKASSNKHVNAESCTKKKLLIVNRVELNNNYDNTKAKDENHNYCTAKNKYKKEPLPMKFRAFPESFWQQPNKTSLISPGNVYFTDEASLHKEGDTSAPKSADVEETVLKKKQEIISQPNIDLLFSLFRNVEEEEKKVLGRASAPRIRRGRPKKLKASIKIVRDDDPYLTSSAADSFLPLIPERSKWETCNKSRKNDQISLLSSTETPINLLSSSNTSNQNLSKILSDLVVKL